ncbi:trans-sialidase [Trypanosoma cruzi Dm28c]|uniref:Trans-sialidase n=2 Tax=Trypanosoma cruzi TaxID=5693 RepID=V5B5M4_TRYCR|nr:trans-sialidase [Trypanosoma cruzi Dm28c]PBJ77091.1 trans-sialidase [Trypanosoma cruzi cruzi]PWU86318.1 putative trans-sialidase, Group VI [Trypanosoma cruzi]PWV01886.1 putative trans-sialidase, Group VI [Trypanosoma cruzi]
MLSRVAAVKAPRTHNRRGVTGSSGRRREGRESEPQRPDMSRHLFCSAVLLLVLVMMCCNAVEAEQTIKAAPDPRSLPKTYFVWRDKVDKETVVSLRVPSLVEVEGDVFAVAEAPCKDGSEKVFTGIASELLTLGDEKSKELGTNAVKTQVLEECAFDEKSACHIAGQDDSKTQTRVLLSRPTTVVKGNDIYMLAGNYSWPLAAGVQGADAGNWGLVLVKGNVTEEKSQKRIFWNDTYAIPWNYNKQHESLARLIGGGGSGVKMEDGTLVFPVEGTRKKTTNQVDTEKDEKTVSLIIHSLKDANSWKLSKGMSDGGCSDPSVVEWKKEDKLIMMTACDDGRRRVYESVDKGESWTEALGTLSRVWCNKQGEGAKGVRSGFITATIDGEDNRNVMLVTLPVYSKEGESKKETGNGKGKLHLWLTDNTHIVDIGPVSDDDVAASSLLYKSAGSGDKKEEKLIALYEKKGGKEASHSLWYVLLTEQLQRVKDVLTTWKKADGIVSNLCPSSAEKDTSSDTACSPTVKITDGLVGFLSDNISENTWRDEYLGVNATVKNNDGKATLHEGSVTFHGAWAEWPVGEQGENQLYHFANYNFTLVATVSIDKLPEGSPIHLLGVKMDDDGNPVLLGLSYENGGKWKLLCGGENRKELSSTSETTHQVVLMLRNGNQGSAYVDGQPVLGNAQCDLKNTKDKKVSHFYIGGDGGAGSEEDVSVTVRNVLLYNRPLDDNEITALNTKLSIPKTKDTKTVKEVTQPVVSKQATLENEIPSSLGGEQQTEQYPLKKSKDEGSGVLSTSAVSSVTNSPAAKESKDQSASGTSPEGHPKADVDSSSEEVQTVDAEAGGAMQGDTPPQTPVDTPDKADTNAPTATNVAQVDPADTTEVGASSGANRETAEGRNGQEEGVHAQDSEVKAAAPNSSLGNVSQGNNSDAGTVRGSGLLPSLLLLLLGLWVFAAL